MFYRSEGHRSTQRKTLGEKVHCGISDGGNSSYTFIYQQNSTYESLSSKACFHPLSLISCCQSSVLTLLLNPLFSVIPPLSWVFCAGSSELGPLSWVLCPCVLGPLSWVLSWVLCPTGVSLLCWVLCTGSSVLGPQSLIL